MLDITIILKECIQNNDLETVKTLVTTNNTDSKFILSFLKEYDNKNLYKKVNKWICDCVNKCEAKFSSSEKELKENWQIEKKRKSNEKVSNKKTKICETYKQLEKNQNEPKKAINIKVKQNGEINEEKYSEEEEEEIFFMVEGDGKDKVKIIDDTCKNENISHAVVVEKENCSENHIENMQLASNNQNCSEEMCDHEEHKMKKNEKVDKYKCLDAADQITHENDYLIEDEQIYIEKTKDDIKKILSTYLTHNAIENRLITAFYNAMCSNTDYFNYNAIGTISQKLVSIIIESNKHKDGEFIRSKISNLNNPMNPTLCSNVVRSIIAPDEYLKLSNEEMKSNNLKMKEQKILQDTLMDMQFKQIESETDMFRCSRCKNRKTTYSQLQTRSADEPMTTFVTCVVCKHRWKF